MLPLSAFLESFYNPEVASTVAPSMAAALQSPRTAGPEAGSTVERPPTEAPTAAPTLLVEVNNQSMDDILSRDTTTSWHAALGPLVFSRTTLGFPITPPAWRRPLHVLSQVQEAAASAAAAISTASVAGVVASTVVTAVGGTTSASASVVVGGTVCGGSCLLTSTGVFMVDWL